MIALHAVLWIMGLYPLPFGTPIMYQFWSGFFIVVLSGVTSNWLRKHNCHVEWCFRSGRYPAPGTPYLTCRRHSPDPAVRERRVTHEHIMHMHRKHLEDLGINRAG